MNFNKAEWVKIWTELAEIDWSEMEEAAQSSSTKVLNIFLQELLPILVEYVPAKQSKRKLKTMFDRRRKLI